MHPLLFSFHLEGETHIRDAGGRYACLLDVLYHSMVGEWGQGRPTC